MASIFIADSTEHYDGRDLEARPLGGTESSVIRMARELARRGHHVTVHTNCEAPIEHEGVHWRPLSGARPDTCDLYLAVQHPRLLSFVRKPKRRAIWVAWQPNHLKHYKQIWRVWWYRPIPVLISLHQVRIYSPFLPRREPHIVIPHGLPDDVRGHPALPAAPPRRAIFASNPRRKLRELVEIWLDRIHPRVPDAVLEVYGLYGIKPGEDAWNVWRGSLLPENVSPAAQRSGQIGLVGRDPPDRGVRKASRDRPQQRQLQQHVAETFALDQDRDRVLRRGGRHGGTCSGPLRPEAQHRAPIGRAKPGRRAARPRSGPPARTS